MDPLRHLKFQILTRGVIPSDRALEALPVYRRGSVVVRDYPTTSGLILTLSQEILVNARLRFTTPDAFPLDHDGEGFVLIDGERRLPITVHSPPLYALENRRLSTGKSVRAVANTHADRIRLTPIHGCAFHCQFCNYPSIAYRRNTLEELVEGVHMALADRIMPHPHALISGGTPNPIEAEFLHLNTVCEALPARFPNLDWDMMLAPRGLHPGRHSARVYRNYLQHLKGWGFKAVSINLELYDEEARRKFIPEKETIGRADYLIFLEQAVETFGIGNVRSILLIGLEAKDETMKGVEALARRGVLVELSAFTADPGAFLARHAEPTAETLRASYLDAVEITTRHGMSLEPFCIACSHNIL